MELQNGWDLVWRKHPPLFSSFFRHSKRHSIFQHFLMLSFADSKSLISSSRPFSLQIKAFFSTVTLTTSRSSSCGRRFESSKKLERLSLSAMASVRRSAMGLIMGSWPASWTNALRRGDRGVSCRDDVAGGSGTVSEKHFGNARRAVQMEIPAHCCHSQLEEKAKLGNMIFHSRDDGIGFVLNVPCAALHVMDIAFLLCYGQR